MGNAAGVDDIEVRFQTFDGASEMHLLQQRAYLPTFVLVNLAAKGIYGKSFHIMLQYTFDFS